MQHAVELGLGALVEANGDIEIEHWLTRHDALEKGYQLPRPIGVHREIRSRIAEHEPSLVFGEEYGVNGNAAPRFVVQQRQHERPDASRGMETADKVRRLVSEED